MNGGGRGVGRTFRVLVAVAALGCGGDAPRRPDTGAGAGQTPPATPNCPDLCARIVDCGITLCNEDTMSTGFTGLRDSLIADCNSNCTIPDPEAFGPTTWECLFQSSCRQVFDFDVCNWNTYYYCGVNR